MEKKILNINFITIKLKDFKNSNFYKHKKESMQSSNEKSFIRIQLKHNYYSESNPYPKELEDKMLKLNLPIIGDIDQDNQEAIIRHETGPEIILLVTAVVSLSAELVNLFSIWKEKRPETKIQITVNSAEEFEKVLQVMNKTK